MRSRIQEIYEYIFADRADIEFSMRNIPTSHQSAHKSKKIETIKKHFFAENEPLIQENDRPLFRIALRSLNAKPLETVLYDNANNSLEQKYIIPDEKEIENQFQLFEKQYHFFEEKEYEQALKKFSLFFKVFKLIADFVEHNNDEKNTIAYQHAYKMLVIFGDQNDPNKYFNSLDDFLNQHNLREEKNSIYSILKLNISKNDLTSPLHLPEWRQLIQRKGLRALRLFSRASEIEKQLGGFAPKNYQQALDGAKSLFYKNMEKDYELAELCLYYDVKETVFDTCLELKAKRKKSDNLPNIIVAGKDVDKPGYYLVKLPLEDPHVFILGHITNCCLSIGLLGHHYVEDSLFNPDNGFYVLLKEKRKLSNREDKQSSTKKPPINKNGTINYVNYEIVGEGYTWLSRGGNLTFDSWENLRPEVDNAVIVPMLKKFAYEVTHIPNTSILRVTIGKGVGRTPREFTTIVSDPEINKLGKNYSESHEQKLIYLNEKACAPLLNDLYQDCQQLLKESSAETKLDFLTIEHITSVQQYNLFKQFLKMPSVRDCLKEPKALSEWLDIIKYYYWVNQGRKIWDTVEKLSTIQSPFDLKAKMKELKEPLLLYAVRAGNAAIVNQLLKAKADINVKDGDSKYTLLHIAKNHEVIRILLEAKINIDEPDIYGNTKFWYAIQSYEEDSLEIANLLIDAGANLNQKSRSGTSLIGYAIHNNNYQITQALLNANIEPTPQEVEKMKNGSEMHAIYIFRNLSQNQFQWFMNQVNKILESKLEPNHLINLTNLIKDIELNSSNHTYKYKMAIACVKLFRFIESLKKDYEKLPITAKESLFVKNPLESEIYQAIFTLLKLVNKELAWHPIEADFFANSSVKESNFIDPLPPKPVPPAR